jgi:hypothetical protein
MKNKNEGEALNERLLAEMVAEVRPKIECPQDLALLLARLEPKAQRKMRAAALMDEALEKSMQSMPQSERAKFKRLLKNVELLGDLEQAAQKGRVDRKMLDKWRNAHELCWGIANAQCRYSKVHSEGVLFLAKRALYLEHGWGYAARLAAQNLKDSAELVQLAAQHDAKEFFITLGRCLSGEIKSTLYDKMDADVADILSENPSITAKEAVRELRKRGRQISEENFRVRKQRLLRPAYKAAQSDWTGKT